MALAGAAEPGQPQSRPFGFRPLGAPGLSPAEAAEAYRLIDALGEFHYAGISLACVAGIDAAEAVRRLECTILDNPHAMMQDSVWDYSFGAENNLVVGVTGVPRGCVRSQPWGYDAQVPGVSRRRLSAGIVCYAVYANPKAATRAALPATGVIEGWDLHPGGEESSADDPADEILCNYLYQHRAVAYCCGYAGIKPADARPFTGPPDLWARLPSRDYWAPNS